MDLQTKSVVHKYINAENEILQIAKTDLEKAYLYLYSLIGGYNKSFISDMERDLFKMELASNGHNYWHWRAWSKYNNNERIVYAGN